MYISTEIFNRDKQTQGRIENTYVVYSPRILKFVYHSSPPKINEIIYSKPQRLNAENLKTEQIQCDEKMKRYDSYQLKTQHSAKIKLYCKQRKVIHLKSRRKQKNSNKEIFDDKSSRITSKTQPLPLQILPNHITVNNFVDSMSCNFFKNCNDFQGVDQGQRRPLEIDDSRKTFQKSVNTRLDQSNIFHTTELKVKKVQSLNQSLNQSLSSFSRRQNIFKIPMNNNDISFSNAQERSKSRKKIFGLRERLDRSSNHDKSISFDRSLSRRKKIFDALPQKEMKGLVKNRYQQFLQTQIPKQIFDNWQKFTQMSQSKQLMCGGELEVVREMKHEQSSVRLNE